jgi:Na+/H+ antiporter NhaD/arsenite permease-like protein
LFGPGGGLRLFWLTVGRFPATLRGMPAGLIAPNPWMILPFGLLLGMIALAPLIAAGWWRGHYPKVAGALGAITLGYYVFGLHAGSRVLHTGEEYVQFIALIGALYVVAGGIHITVRGGATPAVNTGFLLAGAVLANVLGTTGAAMLLIRPWLRMNQPRTAAHHVVFFIFIVANVGGCLTPIGDPPLLLGYLKGVPFWWVAVHGWPMWALAVGLLLAMFYAVDALACHRATQSVPAPEAGDGGWRVEGLGNLGFLAVILGAIFLHHPPFLREALMLGAAAGSYFTTPKSVHAANEFDFHPLQEVAVLFAGIFATMMPALDWLQLHAGQFGRLTPGILYWTSGTLSAGLDNAPTYLSALSALLGATPGGSVANLLATQPLSVLAISVAAVFFGAATYIGNGPNFMVKAIADHRQVPSPGFPGYLGRYTLPFLLPVLAVVWLAFFR